MCNLYFYKILCMIHLRVNKGTQQHKRQLEHQYIDARAGGNNTIYRNDVNNSGDAIMQGQGPKQQQRPQQQLGLGEC